MRFDLDHSSGEPKVFRREKGRIFIDAESLHYRELNGMVLGASREDIGEIDIDHVHGHPYIGTGLRKDIKIVVKGDGGDELGAFMDGPEIEVEGSVGKGLGNSMSRGRILVRGNAGEGAGMGMKGGCIFVGGNVGPRAAIHMQELWYGKPVMVVGGAAGDLLGEYMAGGTVVVLGLPRRGAGGGEPEGIGAGMSGGTIYVRGALRPEQLAREARMELMEGEELEEISGWVREFARLFGEDPAGLLSEVYSRVTAARA